MSKTLSKKSAQVDPKQLLTVRIHVLEAKSLIAADAGGTSDPYVTIKFRDGVSVQGKKTKVIQKNLNPRWDETFEFVTSKNLLDNGDILFKVFDKDLVGKDFLGEVCIPLSNIKSAFNEAEGRWHKLLGKSGENVELGSIFLKLGLDSIDQDWSVLERKTQLASATNDAPDPEGIASLTLDDMKQVEGILKIEIKRAIELPKEKQFGTLDCDPFVVASFSTNTFRTRVIRHDRNPVWNEQLVMVVKKHEANYQIKFSVYDFDQFSSNDFMATASVPISQFIKTGEMEEMEIALEPKKQDGFNRSKLIVGFKFQNFKDLKRQFWRKLAENFDTNDNQALDKLEFSGMLETLNTEITQEKIEDFFQARGNKIELSYDEITDLIDEIIAAHRTGEKIFAFQKCPFTGKPLPDNDEDAMIHLAIQASSDLSQIDSFVMGGFITEAYARKGWFDKMVTFVSRGQYDLGADNANILVQDRKTGQIVEEKMPSYIRVGIRALYQSKLNKFGLGRSSVKNLLQSMSVKQGKKYDHPDSVKSIMPFVQFHKLSVDEVLEPMESFKCFNEFFYRKLKPSARPIGSPDPNVLLSPADSRTMFFQDINDAPKLWIKGKSFTLQSLVKDAALADKYKNGSLVIFRLAPQDYHRYHSPVNGKLGKPVEVAGTLYTVNPMAVRGETDVYTENKRVIWSIQSPEFGLVTLVIIGAMMVGSIVLTAKEGQEIKRNEELGYFAFGGSTVVALFEKDKVVFDADLQTNCKKQLETLVMVGDAIGKKP